MEINITPFNEVEARELTEEIRKNFSTLGERILEIYRRRAWEVLGYRNFTGYTEAEFGLSKTESYNLKRNTLTTLSLLPELGEEAHKIPSIQKELLHKLPSEQRGEGYKEAQQLAKNRGQQKPTAKDLKQVISAKLGEITIKTKSQPPTALTKPNDNLDNLAELREQLRRKTRALEVTFQALEQARERTREKSHQLEQKVHTLNTVLKALDTVRREAVLLRKQNKELKKLLDSLGGVTNE